MIRVQINIIIYIGLILLISCAQQQAPSGGPKDNVPPKLIGSYPQNFSTAFDAETITLDFDEFIQLKSFKKQVVVSPPLKESLETKIKGKSLVISLPDSLKENVTYVINFGDGITDITEFNPLDSNLFVFSTGNYIDSLSIQGDFRDAKSLKKLEGVVLMLYNSDLDSLPYKEIPTYVSKSDKTGKFKVPYLNEGNYKVFALEDKNGNYLYDTQELIGFLDTLVNPKDSVDIRVNIFQEDIEIQYLKNYSFYYPGKLRLDFNLPPKNVEINPLNFSFKKAWFIKELMESSDSAIFWMTDLPSQDSLEIEITADDFKDTILISKLKMDSLSSAFTIKHDQIRLSPFRLHSIQTNIPIKEINMDSVVGKIDTIISIIKMGVQEGDFRSIQLTDSLIEWGEYEFAFYPGALQSIFGDFNKDTLRLKFRPPGKGQFAQLNVSLSLEVNSDAFIEIYNQSDKELKKAIEKVKMQKSKKQIANFGHLKAAKYRMKLTIDKNGDGEWTTGNYLEHIQPERVYLYDGSVEVKAGFDLDLEWVIEQ